ncbi:MAG: hypothetical protein ACR2F5_03930 [Candidatus Limnocylindria bacterium]
MAGNKRESIEPAGGPRFAKRDDKGQLSESVDVGRSLSAEARRSAKKTVATGKGDQGEQKSSGKKAADQKSSGKKTADTKSSGKKDGKKGDTADGKKDSKKMGDKDGKKAGGKKKNGKKKNGKKKS